MALYYSPEQVQEIVSETKAFERGLVLGFAEWFTQDDKRMETVYAVTAEGKFYTSTNPYSNDFNPRGRKWTLCESIPNTAEFVGHYYKPASFR